MPGATTPPFPDEPSPAERAAVRHAKPRPHTVRRVVLRPLAETAPTVALPELLPADLFAAPPPLGLATIADEASAAIPEPELIRLRSSRLPRLSRRPRGPRPPPLMDDERFRIFWLSRLSVQTAQGALLYAFLLIVADRTDSATANSLFVVCSILPSIVFGLPGGIVVDLVPRRPLMVSLNLLRFLFCLVLVLRQPSLLGIFAATLGLWVIHQFYSPSEASTLPAIVPRDRYTAAQALSNLALTVAQLLGLVILAPLLLKTAGPQVLFAVCGAIFFMAAGFAMMLPRLDEHVAAHHASPSLRATLLNGWRGARSDYVTFQALINDVLIGIGMSALIVIMPLYLRRVLDTAAENTVFVFAPAALGLVIGLRYAPSIAGLLGEQRVVFAALLGFAACVGSLGFVEGLRRLLDDSLRLPLNQIADVAGIPSLILVAMLISIPAGFCSALVSVTARSMLLKGTPPSRRGQAVATTALLGNVGALVPTLLAGVAADLFGVEPIAVAIAVTLAVASMLARGVFRPVPLASPAPS